LRNNTIDRSVLRQRSRSIPFPIFLQANLKSNGLEDLFYLNRFVQNLVRQRADLCFPLRLSLTIRIEDDDRGIRILHAPEFKLSQKRGDRPFKVDDKKLDTFIVPLKSEILDGLSRHNFVLILQQDR